MFEGLGYGWDLGLKWFYVLFLGDELIEMGLELLELDEFSL